MLLRYAILPAIASLLAFESQAQTPSLHRAAESPISDAPTSAALPEELSANDWSSIRSAYEATRHAVARVGDEHEAHNPGQRWVIRFDGRGFTTVPVDGDWTWGLELVSWGFDDAPTSTATVRAEGHRVVYAFGEDLEEWWINDRRGLEHGYTVHRRPTWHRGDDVAPLTFTLAVRGQLRPEVSSDGLGAEFLDEAGVTALTYSGLVAFDADRRPLAARLERCDAGMRICVDERGARYPITIDPIAQQAYLKASNTETRDRFGSSVSISGDTVVISAPAEYSNATGVNGNQADNSALFAGAVYVFVRNGTTWSQQAYLKASNTGRLDGFGYSTAISGDTIVVGATGEGSSATGVNGDQTNEGAPGSGAAYVFVRSGGVWTQQAYLKASNTRPRNLFGHSVSASGDTIVVSTYAEHSSATGVNGNQNDTSAAYAGAAYVFVRNGTTWSQQAYLKASNAESHDLFGWSSSVSGDTIVVGARGENSNATGVNGDESDNSAPATGAAYVFVRNGTTWSQQAYLKAAFPDRWDEFGWSVDVSGDTVVVGAPFEDSGAQGVNGMQNDNSYIDSGAGYVFVRSVTTWSQHAYLKASSPDGDDRFGETAAISGDMIVVGASFEDGNATGVDGDSRDNRASNAGAAYGFLRAGTRWIQGPYLKASNTEPGDRFGWSVAVSDGTIVVGAVFESSSATGVNGNPSDNSAPGSGAAYVYREPQLATWSTYGTGCPGINGTPDLRIVSLPNLGGTFALEATNLGTGPAFMLLGFTQLNAPLTAIPQFAPGCTLLTSVEFAAPLSILGGVARWSFALPLSPSLQGARIFNQALELGMPWTLSNGGIATLR